MKKILFYYTHKESLGHTTRTLSILNELLIRYSRKVQISILHGGINQNFIKWPKGLNHNHIPFPFYNRAFYDVGNFRNRTIDLSRVQERSNFIIKKIKEIKPDIFITEFFPLGRQECLPELLEPLLYIKKIGILLYASIGYPYINRKYMDEGTFRKLFYKIISLYDLFFIHTPLNLENKYYFKVLKNRNAKNQYNNFFSLIKHKLIYTGYVLPHNIIRENTNVNKIKESFNAKDKIFVLVSRGGGTVYPKIITNAILTKQILGNKFVFLIVTGPSTTPKEKNLFNKMLLHTNDKGVVLLNYLPKLSSYINSCDISLNMAGYNTSVQLLYFKRKNLVVPYEIINNDYFTTDQLPRAHLLKDYLGSDIINYDTMNKEKLATSIKEMTKENKEPKGLNKECFQGAEITALNIMKN